ncbi:FkbM family methyltransferase [Thermostichus vulcanus]|uniref:FkbM family methyltransferase n=1 Tax=Thermostichus vulcanus str. 'Rupite' TaxID=2813851 RepID=A0ABT0C8B0_THEVL|nr:FkbM family methyltransferase [Thermostichus vulcanus]MCJ2541947.1 FkbM family methyltransferase [Thermostichus vulcanus str. 'Rupite']
MPFPISEILGKDMPFIKIVDVGAMFLGGDNFDKLVQEGHAQVIGFEPQKEECEKLNARALTEAPSADKVKRTYLPYYIGDGSRRKFYLTNVGYTSSLYKPDEEVLKHFEGLSDVCQVIRTEEVQTTRLDDIPELGEVDFLKIDVQGAELDVIRGASKTLKNITVIQTEVEYIPIYKNQALFSDVDVALREHGFWLHGMTGNSGACLKPFSARSYRPYTQVLWCDYVYAKNFMQLESLTPRQRLVMAVILHEIFLSYDLTAFILNVHDQLMQTRFKDFYLAKMFAALQGS